MSAPEHVEVSLTDGQLERLADLVAERLRSPVPAPSQGPLVTARQLAERLGVDPKTVYRHALELGGVQAGRAWRFDLANALAAWPARGGDRSSSEISQPPRTPSATGSEPRRRRTAKPRHCQGLADDGLLGIGRKDADGRAA